jgi:serine/threonine protein kinase
MMNDSINDYKILDVLGEGAFGKVYKALGVDRKYYALKIIPITPKMKDKIREEGRLLTSMEHPNILWAR